MYIFRYSESLKMNYCGVFILTVMHIYITSGSTRSGPFTLTSQFIKTGVSHEHGAVCD